MGGARATAASLRPGLPLEAAAAAAPAPAASPRAARSPGHGAGRARGSAELKRRRRPARPLGPPPHPARRRLALMMMKKKKFIKIHVELYYSVLVTYRKGIRKYLNSLHPYFARSILRKKIVSRELIRFQLLGAGVCSDFLHYYISMNPSVGRK